MLAGLEQGLLEAGYAFFLCSHHHRNDVIERSQIMLVERAVDGLVAIDTELLIRESTAPHIPSKPSPAPDREPVLCLSLPNLPERTTLTSEHRQELFRVRNLS